MRHGLGLMVLLLGWAASAPAAAPPRWIGAWSTAQIAPAGNDAVPAQDLTDATVRQIVRVTLGGDRLRVRFSNAFGTAPLRVTAASVARSADNASARIVPASLRPLRFNGQAEAVIPAGAEYWSDPVALPVAAGADLAITIHLPEPPARQTGHPGARATSYFLPGAHVEAADLPGARTAERWVLIGGVEVEAPGAAALAILGDSITDGHGVRANTNTRWPDLLAARMRADPASRGMAVLNAGIGGNRLLLDGTGPNALARFDRDILAAPGVTHLIVLLGINDLGVLTRDAPATPEQHRTLARDMIAALAQIVARAHAHGITAIGGTIMPDGASGYYHPGPEHEADRAAVNAWIRAPGHFDAVIDFDAVTRDPADPRRLRPDLDSGDGLHPSAAGYRAMAEAVPLSLLAPRRADQDITTSKARAGARP